MNKVEVENVVFNIRRSRFPLQWRQLPVTSSAKPAAGLRHTSRHTDLQAYTVYYTHRHKHVQRKRFIKTDAGYIIHHNFRYSLNFSFSFALQLRLREIGTTSNGPLFPLSPVSWPDTTSKKVFYQSLKRIPRPASIRSIKSNLEFDKEVLSKLLFLNNIMIG